MTIVYHLITPQPGYVVGVYHRCGGVGFLQCFCRGVLVADSLMCFVDTFRRTSDVGLARCWSEPCDIGAQTGNDLTFDIVRETPWMRQSRLEGGSV